MIKFITSVVAIFSANFAISQSIADTSFVNLKDYSTNFVYDMRYATDNNFLRAKVYDCAECILRLNTVKALISANEEFVEKGYKIKIFDCYRPVDIQRRMWAIVPNPRYVANPDKGSIHNRGGAVDITLVDSDGVELDMGTDFDHFGPEAAHGAGKHSRQVQKNRKLLKKVMLKHSFNAFASEWWHYNLDGASKYPVSNQKWLCD